MCLNAEFLIICLIPGFLSFIPVSPSRCPHAGGRTGGRPAEAYPTRGHIKTIPWPLSRNWLSWLKGTKFLWHSLFFPPHWAQSLKTRLSMCASTGDDSVTGVSDTVEDQNLCLLSLCFPQTQLPKILKLCFKDTHLNFYFHSAMPSVGITIITLSQKRQFLLLGNWDGKKLSQKELLTFHIDKLEETNHTPLKNTYRGSGSSFV